MPIAYTSQGFYDLHYIVTKTDEEGTKENAGSADEKIKYSFPIK